MISHCQDGRSGEIYGQHHLIADWDNVVGKGTCYGFGDLGIKSRWGRDFLCLSRLALGSTQPPVQWVLGLFLGYQVTGVWL